jgi:hypothetical protein
MRGRNALSLLSHACLDKLNTERCKAKGSWLEMTWRQLAEKLTEEYNELMAELWAAERGDYSGVLEEAPDVGSVAAFCLDKAISEMISPSCEGPTLPLPPDSTPAV